MPVARRVSQAQEIEAVLQRRIEVLGDTEGRLPSETELAAEFGVSRVTLREALSSLEHRGLILRRQGLGTFINRNASELQLRLDESVEFGELIRAAGFDSGVASIQVQVDQVSEQIARQLLISPGSAVLSIRKVFTANGTRVIYCQNIVPLGLLPPEQQPDLDQLVQPDLSIYALLERSFGRRVAYQLSEVGACSADAETSAALGTSAGMPLLFIEEIGYDPGQRPICYTLARYVPGLIHFRLIRKPVYTLDEPS